MHTYYVCVKLSASEYKKISDGSVKTWICGRVDCTMMQPDNNPNLLRQVAQRLDQLATEEDMKRITKHILGLRCEVNKLSQTEGSELKSRLEV